MLQLDLGKHYKSLITKQKETVIQKQRFLAQGLLHLSQVKDGEKAQLPRSHILETGHGPDKHPWKWGLLQMHLVKPSGFSRAGYLGPP